MKRDSLNNNIDTQEVHGLKNGIMPPLNYRWFKQYLLSAVLVLFSSLGIAQEESKEIKNNQVELNYTLPPFDYNVEARDYIKLLPGFKYKPGKRVFGDGYTSFTGKINQWLINACEYVNYGGMPFFNSTLPVGSIAGAFNVTATGAATYAMQIEIPEGRNGLQPNLAVVYNSMAKMGNMGFGFSLSGVSAITRTSRIPYNDGKWQEIQFKYDRFTLNGARLESLNGNYGENATTYSTEGFSALVATSHGGTEGNPDYFTVDDASGNTSTYGLSNNSKHLTASGKQVFCWYLSSITDKNGNKITYHYAGEDGEKYLTEIKYLYVNSANLASVRFIYENTGVQNVSYVNTESVFNDKLLKEIRVIFNNAIFRKYKFDYFDDIVPKLQNATVYSADENQLNPTFFDWGHTDDYIIKKHDLPNFIGSIDGDDLRPLDFNGDGYSDLLERKKSNNAYHYNLYDIHNNEKINNYLEPIGGHSMLYILDFDGDGKDDCARVWLRKSNTSGEHVNIHKLKIICGNGKEYVMEGMNYWYHNAVIGDFDGDGNQEFIFLGEEWTDYIYTFDYNAHNDSINFYSHLFPEYIDGILVRTGCNVLYNADQNGDGIEDIVLENGCLLFFSLNETFQASLLSSVQIGYQDYLQFVDINGDGLDDVVYNHINDINLVNPTRDWRYKINEYNKWSPIIPLDVFYTENTTTDDKRAYKSFFDIDGDGNIDAFEFYRGADNGNDYNSHFYIYLNKGDFSFKTFHFTEEDIIGLNNDTESFHAWMNANDRWLDYNSDGRIDVINVTSDMGIEILSLFPKDTDDPLLVKSISDGMKNQQIVKYNSILNTARSNKNNQLLVFNRPITVVENVVCNNSITEYTYGSSYYVKNGKGWLGFDSRTVYDNRATIKIEEHYAINETFYVSYLDSKREYLGGSLLSEYNPTYTFESNGSKRFIQKLLNTVSQDYETHIQSKSSYLYNPYNKVKTVTAEIGKIGGETEKKVVTTNGYFSESDILDNRITTQTVATTINGHTQSQTANYTYDSKWNLLTQNTTFGDGRFVKSTYSGYVYGNPGSIVTSGSLLSQNRVEEFEYDNSKRFVTKHVLPNGDFTTSTYDPFTDLVTSKTDAAGNTINMKYGSFGQLMSTIDANGNKTVYSTLFTDEHGAQYKKTTKVNEMGALIEYSNKHGQVVLSEYAGKSGVIQTRNEYYESGLNYGKLKTVYAPSYGSASEVDVQYFYDSKGRVQSVIGKGDSRLKTDYEYSTYELSTTITQPNGLFQTTQNNAWGGVESVTDVGGMISYNDYNALGMPENISYFGNTWSFAYDGQGNRTNLNDPDAGNRSYSYNALGDILTEQLPSNDMVTYEYDILGRITTKAYSVEGNIDYGYVQSGNGKGQLKQINGYNGISYANSYNAQHEVSKKVYNVGDKSFEIKYTYDNLGRVVSKEFPDETLIEIAYYENDGSIREMKVNGDVVAQDIDYDAKGRVTEMTLGENLKFSQGFNRYDFPVFRKMNRISSENAIFHQSYVFDEVENWLISRKDEILDLNDSFGYDSYKRLISCSLNGLIQFAMDYSPTGNILNKSDVGQYQYNNGNNAVTTISEPNYLYFNNIMNGVPIEARLVQDIAYNSFNKPTRIEIGNYIMEIEYGPDKHRRHIVLNDGGQKVWERYYADDYIWEWRNGQERTIVTVGSPDGLLGLNITEDGESQFYYAATDYLGSLLALITPEGNVIETYNYDAWGRRRNPEDWTYNNVPEPQFTRVGYTGHEHWDEHGLINMTGRIYDPHLARFLSPDPYVQMPGNTQNLNRYSYCLNNPLIYTDPSGEFWHLVAGAVIGGTINWALNGAEFNRQGLGYFAIGAVAGALGAGVGAGLTAAAAGGTFGAGFVGGTSAISGSIGFTAGLEGAMGGGALAGGILGGGNTAMGGGSAGDVFGAFVQGATIGAVTSGVTYGALAGIGAGVNALGKEFVRHNYNVVPGESRWLGNRLQLSHSDGFTWHNKGSLFGNNLFRDAGRALNGFLHGAGRPLVPAGGVRRSIYQVAYGTDANGYLNAVDGPISINGIVSPKSVTYGLRGFGVQTNILQINRVSGVFDGHGTVTLFSLNGDDISTNGAGAISSSKVNSVYRYGISTQTALRGWTFPTSLHRISVKEWYSYKREGAPWWAYILGFR